MAAILPSALFPDYEYVAAAGAVTADSIVIPLASLPGLTAGEADDAAGDGRKLAYEIARVIHTNLQALPDASRPTQFLTSESTPTGQGPNEVRKSFTLTFDLNITDTDVASEPA